MELEGKKALVTGGTSGIGREVAKQLAGLGAEVVISGRDAARGAETVAEIEAAGGVARFVGADLADFEAIAALAEGAGEVDILVNNAGIFPGDKTAATEEEAFDRVFAVNVKAPFFLTAAIAPFGSPGVRVNAISPGVVRTASENDPAGAMMRGTPYGAFGTDAIAHAAIYLASDESQFVNGTVIDVDGGRVGVAVIAS
jgi:NAD(P)-dependent dehydrogenase (short-subunit alcohol dehydrogenase family)